jgi:YVTN family beta-propeller protein
VPQMSNKALASPRARLFVFSLAAMLAAVACPLSDAQTVMTTVGVGMLPIAVAVSPVTNKIYVANIKSGNVTVIDGATNTTTTVTAGTSPQRPWR